MIFNCISTKCKCQDETYVKNLNVKISTKKKVPRNSETASKFLENIEMFQMYFMHIFMSHCSRFKLPTNIIVTRTRINKDRYRRLTY